MTRRVEPFHSQTLAWFLDVDRSLCRAFLMNFVPDEFLNATGLLDAADSLEVTSEDVLEAGDRIDVTLVGPGGLVGIEVKTTDASATSGQMARYYDQLVERERRQNSHRPVHLVYVTPFTAMREADAVSVQRLATVREYERFVSGRPGSATHASWSDVVNLYPLERADSLGAAMRDHRAHVRSIICSPERLRAHGRARGLDIFLGEVAVQRFFDAVDAAGVVYDDSPGGDLVFPLAQPDQQVDAMLDALVGLLDAAKRSVARPRQDRIGRSGLLDDYRGGPHGRFHRRLFEAVSVRGWAWLGGRASLGVRVVHPDHSSGVSLCTLTGTEVTWVQRR
jgi:hypothetical protein